MSAGTSRGPTPSLLFLLFDVAENLTKICREIEKFIIRQPPMGEKDDYDSENSWISNGLPSSSRRRRRGGGDGEICQMLQKTLLKFVKKNFADASRRTDF